MALDNLKMDRHWCIVSCSAVTGKGLQEGIEWVVAELAGPDFKINANISV